jgi:adenine deaminase
MRNLHHKLAVARGELPAELLFKNGRLVNVLSGEIHDANIAVEEGRIVGLGDYKGRKTIDLRGAFIAPSLIDGHFHVESSQLTAPEFARAVTPHGTGAVVIDPGLGRHPLRFGIEQKPAAGFFHHAAFVRSGDRPRNSRGAHHGR